MYTVHIPGISFWTSRGKQKNPHHPSPEPRRMDHGVFEPKFFSMICLLRIGSCDKFAEVKVACVSQRSVWLKHENFKGANKLSQVSPEIFGQIEGGDYET